MKKSGFRVLSEALAFGKLGKLPEPKSVPVKKMNLHELSELVMEEFKDAKDAADVKVQKAEAGFDAGDKTLEKELEWMKVMGIKEAFKKEK